MLYEQGKTPSQEQFDILYENTYIPLFEESATITVPWETVEILPHPSRPRLVIESMGLAHAGKSSMLAAMENELPQRFSELDLTIGCEFGRHRPAYQLLRDRDGYTGNLPTQLALWNELKLIAFFESMEESLTKVEQNNDQNKKPLLLTERGPNDSIAHTMYGIQMEPTKRDSSHKRSESEDFVLKTAFQSAYQVDAVILYGVSLETAANRREAQGKARYGHIAYPDTWNAYEYGHSWWLEHVFPLMHEQFGTGLLVVNGEEPLEENNERVANYIEKLLKT